MSRLILKNRDPDADGCVHRVTPQSAGWRYVGFEVWKRAPQERIEAATGDDEACLVFLGGKAVVTANGEDLGELGERPDPFAGKPYAVYLPPGTAWTAEATTALELAVCLAPGGGDHPLRVIRPDDMATGTRGSATNTRHVCDILPETDTGANSLLVVEVITPSGCWSSYPPHKHDQDNLPEESLLEETYYHRLNPGQGLAFQRIYTDARDLDETVCIEDGDVTLVPKGYHPCGTGHGYDLYYLNVMAGPKRVWRFNTAKEHRWLLPAAG